MVFGQAPCSAGRSKRRNVSYLGLLRIPPDGLSDITDIYKAKYGEPWVGEKVFIVTRQQKNGWEGEDKESSEIVPGKPEGQEAAGAATLTLKVHMHKGCTRDADGIGTPGVQGQQEGTEAGAPENPKTEARNPREIRNPKGEGGMGGSGEGGRK